MRISLLGLFFILAFVFEARATQSITGFCFNKKVSLAQVKSYLSPILMSKDKVYVRESGNCLEIPLSENRKNLFETYLGKRYDTTRVYRTDGLIEKNQAISDMPQCRLQVEKITKSNLLEDEFSVGSKNRFKRTESKGHQKTTSSLLLTSGVKGSLAVNDQSIEISCHVYNERYRIEVALTSDAGGISTSVNTRKGGRLNLGQLVEELKNRSKNLDINKGLSYGKKKGKSVSDYFLIIP